MSPPPSRNGRGELIVLDYDPELAEGARNAVFTCLAVRPGERCILMTDEKSLSVGAALADQFTRATDCLQTFVLEDLAERPLRVFPPEIIAAMAAADVTCYAASAEVGELPARMQMTAIVNLNRIRHGHMVSISERIMKEGMRADFTIVDALSQWVRERVKRAREIRVTSPAGTDLRASFSPELKWRKTSGIITPEIWGNLPGGEIFTCPAAVEGVYVCDGVLGDWFAPKYGDVREHPLTVTIRDSRIAAVACEREDLYQDFVEYTSHDENANRVGEFALGTNVAVKNIIGHILQDEKMPGVHIAFGNPYREHTGAQWSSGRHIDLVGRDCDVWVDGVQIMEKSRYLVDLADLPA
jgi:aminopeptidase